MKKEVEMVPVLINLAALASFDGINDDPIQMMTSGELYPGRNSSVLKYIESQEDEETGQIMESEIRMEISGNQVTMNRTGDFSNVMMFQKDKRFETTYQTPFGDIPMAIYPREVLCDIKPEAGRVHLRYELSMQGNYTSTNELNLEYWARNRV